MSDDTATQFFVVVKAYEDNKYKHEVGPVATRRMAEKTERGMNINLNHDHYYTEIEERSK